VTVCFIKNDDGSPCTRPATHNVNGVEWCCDHFTAYFEAMRGLARAVRDQFDVISADHYLDEQKEREILTTILNRDAPRKK
jgi:hypothetical protein